jgi:hypothetical protein
LVNVVADVVVTTTGDVVPLADAPGALPPLATVKLLPETAVILPNAPPPKPRPPPGAPDGGVPFGRPEGRIPPGPPPPPPAPGAQLPFTGALSVTLVAATVVAGEPPPAALRTAAHCPTATSALVAGTVAVMAVVEV